MARSAAGPWHRKGQACCLAGADRAPIRGRSGANAHPDCAEISARECWQFPKTAAPVRRLGISVLPEHKDMIMNHGKPYRPSKRKGCRRSDDVAARGFAAPRSVVGGGPQDMRWPLGLMSDSFAASHELRILPERRRTSEENRIREAQRERWTRLSLGATPSADWVRSARFRRRSCPCDRPAHIAPGSSSCP